MDTFNFDDDISFDGAEWKARDLAVDAIQADPELQLRAGLDERLVSEYAEKLRRGIELPPVHVGKIDRAYVMIDGFHRHAAAKKVGRQTIFAKVRRITPDQAQLLAFRSNCDHGKKLTTKDKQRRIEAYIQRGYHLREDGTVKSCRQIEKDLNGVPTYRTIHKYLQPHNVVPGDPSDDGFELKPWRPQDIPPDEELKGEVEACLAQARALAEQIDSVGVLEEVEEAVDDLSRWVAARIAHEQFGDLGI